MVGLYEHRKQTTRTLREAPGTPRPRRWRTGTLLVLALLAAALIVCHGCHGDEDTELFSRGWWILN